MSVKKAANHALYVNMAFAGLDIEAAPPSWDVCIKLQKVLKLSLILIQSFALLKGCTYDRFDNYS